MPRTPRRRGALRYLASELLLPPLETADAGRAAAAAAGAAVAARSLGGAAAAAAGAPGTARSIGSAAAAAVRIAATADAIGAAVTARILGGKLSDRASCRYRIGVCHGVRRRGDRRRSHTRHEQRSHEFQFRHHASGLPLPCELKTPNFRANPMSQLSWGITTAASRSQAAGDGVVAVGATVAEDREQMVVPRACVCCRRLVWRQMVAGRAPRCG